MSKNLDFLTYIWYPTSMMVTGITSHLKPINRSFLTTGETNEQHDRQNQGWLFHTLEIG